jgi:hypothetical protein
VNKNSGRSIEAPLGFKGASSSLQLIRTHIHNRTGLIWSKIPLLPSARVVQMISSFEESLGNASGNAAPTTVLNYGSADKRLGLECK